MSSSVDDMIQKLRFEMYELIDKYGVLNQMTILKSQELDILIVAKMECRGAF